MNINQNNVEITEKEETIVDKTKGFLKKHRKAILITAIALFGGTTGVIAITKKNKKDEDDISDVSWEDLEESNDQTESESNTDAE